MTKIASIAAGASPDKTIMYLSYGSGIHVQESIFSLLTAFWHLPPDTPGYRYVVYTDRPDAFANMDVEVRRLEAGELADWMDGKDYIHRRKTLSILDAMRRFPGAVAFVDCDTYFRRSPARLFERIGPGRTVLHVLEAHLLQSKTEIDSKLSVLVATEAFHGKDGREWSFSPNSPMWNSGVVGIDTADLGLMQEVPGLIDQIWTRLRVHHVEQFVTGCVLASTEISECRDIVFHYWADYLREPFRKRLPSLLAAHERDPLAIRAKHAFANRPQPSPLRWIKVRMREIMRRAGLPVPGMLKSA